MSPATVYNKRRLSTALVHSDIGIFLNTILTQITSAHPYEHVCIHYSFKIDKVTTRVSMSMSCRLPLKNN
jgi:hypothetical protein